MSDDALENLPAYNRVSIRAVLVHDGEDPAAALAKAGLVDAVALPVVLGEQVELPGGILGDGITPNLIALLETSQPGGAVSSHQVQYDPAPGRLGGPLPDDRITSGQGSVAVGMQSLAPISKIGG